MSAPDPYAASPEVFNVSHWKEAVKSFRPSENNFFSRDNAEGSLVGYVEASRIRAALRNMIGYDNTAFPAGPGSGIIQRTNPITHPVYTNLYCTSAAESQFRPPYRNALQGPVVAQLKIPQKGTGPGGGPSLGNYAGYQMAQMVLRFQPLPYPVLEDTAIAFGQEYLRNTWIETETPNVDFLSLDGFQQTFFEGSGCPAPTSNPCIPGSTPPANQVPSEFGIPIAKSDVVVHWKNVPNAFLMTTGTTIPSGIVGFLGGLNGDMFFGYPQGTMLFTGVRLKRNMWGLAAGTQDLIFWDVDFHFRYFDPPKGVTGPALVEIKNPDPTKDFTRGWICHPWRGSTATGDLNAGLWFGASFDGTSAGKKIFQYGHFYEMGQSPN